MKTVVVDCSTVVPWFFPEENAGLALKVFDHFRNREILCCAPTLLYAEFGNAALKKTIRKMCGADHAAIQIGLFLKSGIRFYRCDELLPDAFTIAQRSGITVYDALYCACARTLGSPLATLDARMTAAATGIGVECFGKND